MSRDMLLYGMTEDEQWARLLSWSQRTDIHKFVPDFHRLQLERWIWDRRARLTGRVMDVGVDSARRWIGSGYFTLGFTGCDVAADLLALPFADESIDNVVLTEVLEHCEDPPLAIREVHRVMKPGGLLLVTSPFIWPDHRTEDYPDYWRFTEQGWEFLLRDFWSVKIHPCCWTKEGGHFYDMLRRFECMGMRDLTKASTGYLCEATK